LSAYEQDAVVTIHDGAISAPAQKGEFSWLKLHDKPVTKLLEPAAPKKYF